MKRKIRKIIPYCLVLIILVPLVRITDAAAIYIGTYKPALLMYGIGYDSALIGFEVDLFKTRHELDYFYGQNRVRYSLDTSRTSEEKYRINNFLEHIAKYDDKFFEKNDLVIVKSISGSSMICYRLKSIEYKYSTAVITITIDAVNTVSTDASGFFTFVEFKKRGDITDAAVTFVRD